MKKTIYKIIYILAFAFTCIIINNTKVEAANVSLTSSTLEPDEGESVTVTASVTAGAWNLQLAGNGKSETIYGYTQSNANSSDSKSISFTAGTAGTKYTFTLTGDMTDISSDNSEPVNKSLTITVKTPAPKPDTNSDPQPEQPKQETPKQEQPKVEETPNFTDVNKKMYTSKDNMNLRASWSTSSEATSVNKGTELTVTGTSTNKVNGYIWYRVSYNGQKLYVASNLLTSTKPEETEEPEEKPVEEEPKEETPVEEPLPVNEENEEETIDATEGLKSLEIQGVSFEPAFRPDVYEYRVILRQDISEISINAVPVKEKATVTIAGNSNLQEGENLITIVVYNDADEISTYQITLNKSTLNLTETDEILRAGTIGAKNKVIILISIFVALFVGLIIVMILRRITRKDEEYEEDYEEVDNENIENNYARGEIFTKIEEIVENIEEETIQDENIISSKELQEENIESKEIQEENTVAKIKQKEIRRPRRDQRKGKHF